MLEKRNDDKVRIDIVDMTELTVWVSEYLNNDSCNVILVASKQLIELANEDEQLREIVEDADMILPGANVKLNEVEYNDVESDVIPLEIESIEATDDISAEKTHINTDVVEELTRNIRKEDIDLLMLTDNTELIDGFKKKIETQFPKINYCGNCYTDENSQEDDVINKINAIAPDILCCTLKTPFQEKWVIKNKNKINAKLCILIGGEVEDVLIKKSAGNKWINKFGLDKIYAKVFSD